MILEKRAIGTETIEIIKVLYRNIWSTIKTNNKDSKEFQAEIWVWGSIYWIPCCFVAVIGNEVGAKKRKEQKQRIERKKIKINAIVMRFLWKIEEKTGMDRIRNKIFR